ncbi:NlpC/P60 family protein [Pelosinus sp. UFO1]|uniref:NlpC/P60 family protein n=1 Tax=Pelosinus sp. UFO1 TaxID=484770 RepID=UPI0004D148DD|nr:NlpC/P60 family protein [Pelosinus sp. UFO1]AIF51998.1 phage cell wall peptidase, NlpC/P60 family [Pelosinus sp. UFO1]
MNRDEIIKTARSWIGTKWQHQQSLKGVACDCIGFVRGIYKEITGISIADNVDYPQTAFYYCREEKMYPEIQKHLKEISVREVKPGDILTFAMKEKFPDHHLGIVSYDGFFIHACGDFGIGKVIETRMDENWQKRIRHAFQFPGVVD